MTDVAIVGAGIIGAALADALVRRGRTVTLLESGRPGGGTSATSFAWINSHKKHALDYHAINLRGVEAWRRIAADLPDTVAFTGTVAIAGDDTHRASLTQRTERLIGLGYPARFATPAEARDRTPLPVADDALVAIFDGEGHAFPGRWIAHLTARVPVRTAAVTGIDGHDVLLADGDRVTADAVVICAGTATERLVASAGGVLPLVPPEVDSISYGYLADVVAPGHGVTGIVKTDRLGLRPGEDGTLLVQALDLDRSADPAGPPPDEVAAEILRRITPLLPRTSPRVSAVRVGHRVIPADARTAAGRIAPGSPVWAIATHSGVTLAPWLAEVIADELCGGAPEPLLAAFRPDRFLTTTTHAPLAAPRTSGDQ
ncbi:NAD(P)/FAD-dependent oxidoreductase [Catenuloplanes japonicus]|uniref:NAD(P)/FAD-dependent oxidoreductase n=1 Tax=Catenuloplanes japonicus TaxID=33876 RepID=UPI0006907B12|nr:FAD-binding oxidoreductase [Catenuloplanes japonicus]